VGSTRGDSVTGQYDDTFRKYSKRFFGPGFQWRLFKAQAMAESRLDPKAASGVGARGLMQLMPMTFREVASRNPEFRSIDDPSWNIAAGICYDSRLWGLWTSPLEHQERVRFMLGSYNAGRGTLLRARALAERRRLDISQWSSLRSVAPEVPRWRHLETFGYVDRIETNLQWLCTAPGAARALPRAAALRGAPPPTRSPVPIGAPASPPADSDGVARPR
jgi:membrane-bound lytic murein transglycosylase MltF